MNGDEGIVATSFNDESLEIQRSKALYHTDSTQGPNNPTSERVFTSPSTRFPMQLVIYAEDLPEDMQFHPTTEAIVYKNALSDPSAPVVISPNVRRKVFMYPKNITVAEVTELGLERFGIQDGVIDGGDEVEDKTTKRRSVSRVRYVLMVSIDGQGMLFFLFFGTFRFKPTFQSESCHLRAKLLTRFHVHHSIELQTKILL